MSRQRQRFGWSRPRIIAAVIVLALAVLNLGRVVGSAHPPSDPGTLVGEIALILLDLALLFSAFFTAAFHPKGVTHMSILKTPSESEAVGEVAALYAEDLDSIGYVPNYSRAMALNPEAVRAWEALARTIAFPLGMRRWELVTLAAARALRSQDCLLAHGKKSLDLFAEPDLIRIAEDYHDAGLSPAEVEMMDFAVKVSTASSTMTDADSQRLRDVGFSDVEIVNITLAAAARNYFSRSIQALAVELDVPPDLSGELKRALIGTV